MALQLVSGGFTLSSDDERIRNRQKALTREINEKFIQVGAIFLKPASKHPIDASWFTATKGQTDLQAWIDDPEQSVLNTGFNLQFGWMDVDMDGPDPEYPRAIRAAMQALGVDTRFSFGRRSFGVPTHTLVKLHEDESTNFEELRKFIPGQISLNRTRYHTELRSFPTNTSEKNVEKYAKQVVVPGSVYPAKEKGPTDYDISIWYTDSLEAAQNVRSIAETSARVAPFMSVVRSICFGTIAYLLRDKWVEGSRQVTATKLTGWLARIIADSVAINENETLSRDVQCPLDSDAVAEKLIHFLCSYFGDDEPHMRVRTYYDASEKLARNSDAKIPGWTSITELLGADEAQALRTIITPGADVSNLTKMAERYIYDESDNKYIDRERHRNLGAFVHDGADLERRHKGDVVFVGNKPKEAFKLFESSNLRKRVDYREMYPDTDKGLVFRINSYGKMVPDESDEDANTVFNTWQGWPIEPVERIDPAVMEQCEVALNKMLALLTRDNDDQANWLKSWIAWTRQNPGIKQQIAWVIIGGQGVGKSFLGNTFMKAIFGSKLWGTASAKVVDDKFNVGPFKNKMFVFIDEAKFTGPTATEEIKKLIRNTDISGMEKFEEARDYRIFARMGFASNTFKTGVAQRNTVDRALFYIRATDAKHMRMSDAEFIRWTEQLKPFYDDFAKKLDDPNFVRHMVRYFCDYPCERHAIESIEHSSGNDPEIALSNASWTRRVTKSIIESGWIAAEDSSFDMPFEINNLRIRVAAECRLMGYPNVGAEDVMGEFHQMNCIKIVQIKGKRMMQFKNRWGDIIDLFKQATGLEVDPYRDVMPSDRGENTCDPAKPESRIGGRAILTDRF